jgi:outer membrane receptor protein involved in Fe transport
MTPSTFDPGRRTQRWGLGALVAAALLALSATAVAAQQTGRIVGRVTDAQSGAPIGEAQVFIPGTGIGGLTRQNGTFVILEAPAGAREVRVERIGLASVSQQVTVVAGQAVEVNFTMSTQALGLDEIVVTGTAGASRRREVGNTIAQLNVADLPNKVTQPTELLQAAAPGIQVTQDAGVLGGGFNVRLRGNKSVAMTNQPIIYIDGIRMQSKPFPQGRALASGTSGSGGGVNANPLNSINPNDIERIEVIKGSAATTLYGTEASAGVIQVFTKRGASGAPVWNVETTHIGLHSVKLGPPPFEYHRIEPYLRTGYLGNYTGSVRGGGQNLQYFTSGQYESGFGILPQDTLTKYAVRGNFTFSPSTALQFQWNTAFANTWQRNTPQGGNASGITHNAYRGYGNYFNTEDPKVIWTLFTQNYTQTIERFTTGATATYSPLAALTNRLTIGYDLSQQRVRGYRPFGFIFFETGSIFNDTWENRLLTFDYVGSYSFDIMTGLKSTFSWGGQAAGEDTQHLNGYIENFPGNDLPTVSSGATNVRAEEDRSKVWNAGFFFQNVFDISNRYFVTVGARVDGNSAFGSGFGLQLYPKASASWVISDEAFWREGWGSLKLRTAYGQSGRAPGAFDAVRTWQAGPWSSQPALVPQNLGSPDLGPEVTAEFEAGFDGSWLDDRVTLATTYFRQTTKDALFGVRQIPSNGFLRDQRTNIGELKNSGLEVSLMGTPLRTADWQLDLGVDVTTNAAEVTDLGGIAPFSTTNNGWIQEGHPVPAIRTRWVRNGEKPNPTAAGATTANIAIPSCTAAAAVADPTVPCIDLGYIHGPAQPTLTVGPNLTIRAPFGVTLAARGEFRGGFYTTESNFTDGGVGRSAWMPACWPYYTNPYDGRAYGYKSPTQVTQETGKVFNFNLKPDTPARFTAMCTASLSNSGYSTIKGDYFKLRSVSAQIPLDFAFPDRVSNTALTLSLNNYYRWLNDEWIVGDPEMGIPVDGLVSGSASSSPPPTYQFSASLRLQF